MQNKIVMPALSAAMKDGRIAKWHVREGQAVAAGDVIAEIATETATVEIEAKSEGRVEKILVPAGTAGVRVNTPIAVIRDANVAARPADKVAARRPSQRPVHPAPALPRSRNPEPVISGETGMLSYREALRDALAEEMRRDPAVFLLGVDVAQNRGAQKVSQGLLDEFGRARVITAPGLEDTFTGLAIGAALSGLRPVVEFTSWAIALEAIHHILGAAAETGYVSGGAMTVPIVLRGPNGWAPGMAGSQSRCFASLFAQVPGLKVVAPASPADAKGLLKASVRDPGPVVVLEHELLYGCVGPVPQSADWISPLGTARIARRGRDITIVAYGRAVYTALEAAQALDSDGVDAEVIDLRSLRPLDMDAVVTSVSRTRRLLTVEEGWPTCSLGSEITASVVARAFDRLAAPPGRLSGSDTPMPYAETLKALAVPDAGAIVTAARTVLNCA
jgi:pyruvate dehydrogenase E1 component beta subunit